jgi:hypothetical protein
VEYPSVKAASSEVTMVMILPPSFRWIPASLMKKKVALALMSNIEPNGNAPPLSRQSWRIRD